MFCAVKENVWIGTMALTLVLSPDWSAYGGPLEKKNALLF